MQLSLKTMFYKRIFRTLKFDNEIGPNRSWLRNRPKFILGSKAWGLSKTKGIDYSLLSLKMISFGLFLQASQPNMNFNILKLVYWTVNLSTAGD